MKEYLLSFYQPHTEPPSPEVLEAIATEIEAIRAELRAQGSWVFGGGLHAPSTATVLRPGGDQVMTIDGPFAEGKEYIGGLAIIRAPDLDAALEWGRRYAKATTLPIEVRPFQEG
jgi:hypothetical protein